MKKNIIILLILSMLAMQLPTIMAAAADEDAREMVTFNMRHTLAASPNTGKITNSSLAARSAFGTASVAGKNCAWTDISYTSIAAGAEWVSFSEELKNDASEDLSAVVNDAKVVYTLKAAASTVDLTNLYFTVVSANGAITGISADSYITDIHDGFKTVALKLSDFTGANAVSFVSGKTFDASSFSGMGILRKKVDNPPSSTGRIQFSKMSVVSIPAVTDMETSVRNGIELSFTKSSIATIDKYELTRTGGTAPVTLTLTDDDLTLENGKYVYVDTTTEVEVEYSYKIRMHESEYDMYSPWSAAVTGEVSEDDAGEEIPADGASTIYWDILMRNCDWAGGEHPNPTTGSGNVPYTQVNASSVPGMGSTGKVARFDPNPAKFVEYSDVPEQESQFAHKIYRGYMAGGAEYPLAKGGDNGNEKVSNNISDVKDTGYAIFETYIDEAVSLENLYFMLGDAGSDGSHNDSRNYVGVPVLDYMSNEDKGQTMYVAIPLTDFTLSNPHVFQNMRNNEWSSYDTPDVVQELDWKRVRIMGILRRVRDGNTDENDPLIDTPAYTSGYVYFGDALITNIAAPTDFKVYDVKENKVILKWTHTADAAVKYNIYKTEGDGERTLIGESTKNQYVDNDTFTAGVTYKYEIEAVDKYGTKSPVKSDSTMIRTIDHPRKFTATTKESATDELAVELAWTAPQFGDLASYRIYRDGVLYDTLSTSETTYKDTSLTEHNDYTYTMTAVDTDGLESIQANPVTITASCLAKPTSLGYEVKNVNQVELSWNAPDFAEKYYVYLNGTRIAETNEIVYTAENIDYDTALTFGVRAVNAAGRTSNEAKTAEFVIKNPKLTSSLIIYDDSLNSELSRQPSAGVSVSETNAKSIIGKKSLCIDFTTRKADTVTGALAGTINIKDYRDNGAHLGLWLWADKNTDLSKLEIGVGMKGSVVGTSTTFYSTVKASDYASETQKWVYLDIPLKDIPDTCQGAANGLTQTSTMDYAAVAQYVIRYNNSQQETGPVVYVDQMTIDTGASWTVSSVRDSKGTETPSISAGAESITLQFTEDMDADTLTVNGITLSYTENGETKYVNVHGSYNASAKTYTLNFLEPLKPSAEYTLNVSGAFSALGMGGSYTTVMTTDASEPAEIDYTLPAITPVITSSSNGSVTTITVSMPSGRNEAVKGYSYTLKFNSVYVALNGSNAVTEIPNGATVTKDTNSVTVSGDLDGNNMSGTLMKADFSTVTAGATSVSVTGTVNVYNALADNTAQASISGDPYQFTVSKYLGQGSSSGSSSNGGNGGNGGNGAASRDEGDKKESIDVTPSKTENTVGTADSFTDINDVEWARDAILYLAKMGYINGFDDGTYRPNDTITREQFAKMIIMVLGYNTYSYDTPAEFADVDADAWYANFVTIAAKSGLINGIDDNNFGAGMEITRQDMCTIIYRAMKSDNIKAEEKFADIQFDDEASDYAKEAIRQLYRYGLVNGVGGNMFDPFGPVTRAMAAKVLYQLALLL